MPIRLRMAMHGHAHKKIFHIVAINNKLARNAKPAELLGIYDPHSADDKNPRVVRWSVDRIRYWLSVGAIPSKPVAKLLQLVRFQFILSPRNAQLCLPFPRDKYSNQVHLMIPIQISFQNILSSILDGHNFRRLRRQKT